MGYEIEKKYLVINNKWRNFTQSYVEIKQGYITTNNNSTVRVRIIDNKKAFLTLKDSAINLIRKEFEYQIPLNDGLDIFNNLCDCRIIKNRYIIPIENNLKWEIDVYLDKNKPLVVAELELFSTDTSIIKLPDWIGLDITLDPKYKNLNLAKHPYNIYS